MHPRLEKLFDRLVGPEELVRIDKLEIELDQLSLNQFNYQFVEQVIAAIEKRLKELLGKKDATVDLERIPVSRSRFQLWLDFLEKGYLNWSAGNLSDSDLHRAVLENLATELSALEQLKTILQQNPVAIKRLLFQHEDRFFQHLVESFTAKKQDELLQLLLEIQKLYLNKDHWVDISLPLRSFSSKQKLRHQFWQMVLDIVLHPVAELSTLKLFLALFKEWFHLNYPQKDVKQIRSILDGLQALVLENKTTYPVIFNWFPLFYREIIQEFSLGDKSFSMKKEGQILEIQIFEETDDVKKEAAKSEDQMEIDEESIPPTKVEKGQIALKEENPKGKESEAGETLQPGLKSWESETPSSQLPKIEEWLDQYPDLNLRDGTSFYIQNAGLILIHPFLPAFFKKLNLLNKGQFVNDQARQKAVHLIWYLATGETNQAEYDLVLPKFLCGVPLNYPLERAVEITSAEQEEANNLLQAAIDHWEVLKNTSPDGLREGFLQRDGKLELRKESWYLRVEQKAIDVLLDRLPWNLSIIKLPWMLEILKVEWA